MQKILIPTIFLILLISCTSSPNTIPKTDTSHDLDTITKKEIKDTVPLCEQENPDFDTTKTCQETMQQRHPNQTCTFTLGVTNYTEMGSCTDCIISCQ